MKKILFLALFSTICFSQTIIVKYNVLINTNDVISSKNMNYLLKISNNYSSYYNVNDTISQLVNSSNESAKTKINGLTKVKLSDNNYAFINDDYFYKDYQKDSIVFNEILGNKKILVKDKLNNFDWTIQSDSLYNLKGFHCQKARTKFRGREYIAYFSSEISSFGGPWKFDGLPGLILSIKSLDNYFAINMIDVSINTNSSNIENIYLNDKPISWENFKLNFQNHMKKILNYLKSKSENGEGGSVKISDKIEDLEIPEMKF